MARRVQGLLVEILLLVHLLQHLVAAVAALGAGQALTGVLVAVVALTQLQVVLGFLVKDLRVAQARLQHKLLRVVAVVQVQLVQLGLQT